MEGTLGIPSGAFNRTTSKIILRGVKLGLEEGKVLALLLVLALRYYFISTLQTTKNKVLLFFNSF